MLSWDRLWLHGAKARLWRWLLDEVVRAPMEPILHPSATRLRWAGLCTLMGNLVFYVIWTHLWPQPYESLVLRVGTASLGLFLFLPSIARDSSSRQSAWLFSLICWISLPSLFSGMYWMNGGNPVWLASLSAMLLIYYHLTDWRLATLGSVSGMAVGWLLTHGPLGQNPGLPPAPNENAVVLGFAWCVAFLLGMSSANLRRTRLINTLSTMGVMAHELRTPLATVNLMGDVLRNLAQHDLPEGKRKKMDELATRLQSLVRNMNRQIDTQISNAQLLRLPNEKSLIPAAELVHSVVSQYPYRSSRERDCVQVQITQDFCFQGSRPLFEQLLSNLLKNALHSLAASRNPPVPGDLRIDVGVHRGKGRLAMTDKGLGIPYEQQQRIFEPFFSTQSGAGSGLGLTFCKNVVEAANGRLSVHSEPEAGAVFMVDLPLLPEIKQQP
jgi:two-component system CAI-1 autoinducer sensor kinase/phosphatase CqsS